LICAGLCPSTSSSGGKTHQGRLMSRCNKWLRWAFVEAAWVAIGCSPYFGDHYKRKRALGKKGFFTEFHGTASPQESVGLASHPMCGFR
jgi:transposase